MRAENVTLLINIDAEKSINADAIIEAISKAKAGELEQLGSPS